MSDKLLPEIISPEGLNVAEAYLTCNQNAQVAAEMLNMPIATFRAFLDKREVKAYLDQVFFESGFRNRDKLFGVMDELIKIKLEELEESGMGTSADILELLKTQHKMKMDEMKMQIEYMKAVAATSPTNQTNIQNNISIPGSKDGNYMSLMDKLISGGRK